MKIQMEVINCIKNFKPEPFPSPAPHQHNPPYLPIFPRHVQGWVIYISNIQF